MAHYLIEFRFFGKAKFELRKLIWNIDRRFHLGRTRRHRPIPHITLVGAFFTKNERRLIADFKEICSNTPIMHFKLNNYGTFDETGVVFVNIEPDENLDKFRWDLSQKLSKYCKLQHYDLQRKFYFHATISSKLHQQKLNQIKAYIQNLPKPEHNHCLIRVTLIKNQKILYEYDFFLNRLLNRRQAKSKTALSETYQRLMNYLQSSPQNRSSDKQIDFTVELNINNFSNDIFSIKERLISRIIGMLRQRNIFCISDLHLDHANIIRFCNRPFNSIEEMNDVIIKNWNSLVKKNDIVFFLGDMSYGRSSRKTSYWIKKLNGNLIFIKGNHDLSRRIKFYDKLILNISGQKILLTHDPKNIPDGWQGWVIHGHTHNNKPEYPLVSKKNKTINISAELLDYKPIPLKRILELLSEE